MPENSSARGAAAGTQRRCAPAIGVCTWSYIVGYDAFCHSPILKRLSLIHIDEQFQVKFSVRTGMKELFCEQFNLSYVAISTAPDDCSS